jgi:hypothetical protein
LWNEIYFKYGGNIMSLTFSPANINFGTVRSPAVVSQDIDVTNNFGVDIVIESVSSSSSKFDTTLNTAAIASGIQELAAFTVETDFLSGDTGEFNSTITVTTSSALASGVETLFDVTACAADPDDFVAGDNCAIYETREEHARKYHLGLI